MTLHKTTVWIRGISLPLSLPNLLNSVENIPQIPIRKSSVTNSEIPKNQINIKNPFDNSAYKENAYSYIYKYRHL